MFFGRPLDEVDAGHVQQCSRLVLPARYGLHCSFFCFAVYREKRKIERQRDERKYTRLRQDSVVGHMCICVHFFTLSIHHSVRVYLVHGPENIRSTSIKLYTAVPGKYYTYVCVRSMYTPVVRSMYQGISRGFLFWSDTETLWVLSTIYDMYMILLIPFLREGGYICTNVRTCIQ